MVRVGPGAEQAAGDPDAPRGSLVTRLRDGVVDAVAQDAVRHDVVPVVPVRLAGGLAEVGSLREIPASGRRRRVEDLVRVAIRVVPDRLAGYRPLPRLPAVGARVLLDTRNVAIEALAAFRAARGLLVLLDKVLVERVVPHIRFPLSGRNRPSAGEPDRTHMTMLGARHHECLAVAAVAAHERPNGCANGHRAACCPGLAKASAGQHETPGRGQSAVQPPPGAPKLISPPRLAVQVCQ